MNGAAIVTLACMRGGRPTETLDLQSFRKQTGEKPTPTPPEKPQPPFHHHRSPHTEQGTNRGNNLAKRYRLCRCEKISREGRWRWREEVQIVQGRSRFFPVVGDGSADRDGHRAWERTRGESVDDDNRVEIRMVQYYSYKVQRSEPALFLLVI